MKFCFILLAGFATAFSKYGGWFFLLLVLAYLYK
jgi:hypothetical protein